jgi:hypothetical protein
VCSRSGAGGGLGVLQLLLQLANGLGACVVGDDGQPIDQDGRLSAVVVL